jgi:hypothetical protein
LVLIQLRKQRGLLVHEILARSGTYIRVRFHASISADMKNIVAAFSQDSADQQAPVAVCGILFSAHQCNPKVRDAALEAFNTAVESSVFSDAAVEHMSARIIVSRIAGTAAQLRAQEQVFDSRLGKIALNALAIELRRELGIRRRPRIDYNANAIFAEQPQELLR